MRLIKKILLWTIGLLITIIGLAYGATYFFMDTIKLKALTLANEQLAGEISIEKVDLSMVSEFPYAILNLDSVMLMEHKLDSIALAKNPVLSIDRLEVSMDMIDLIKGKYSIGSLSINGAALHLINYEDSTLNIINAIGTNEQDSVQSETKLSLSLETLGINNMIFIYEDQLRDEQVVSNLKKLDVSRLVLLGDSLSGNLELDFQLDSMTSGGTRYLKSHTLTLSANVEADLETLEFSIAGGDLKLDRLEATLDGNYHMSDSGYVDVRVKANHNNLSELATFELLNPEYLPDIRKGKLMIDAHMVGNTLNDTPIIEAVAKMEDLEVHNTFGKMIEHSGFSLKFYSGEKQDMSDGALAIDSIEVAFGSGGYFRGNVAINNFTYPSFKANWEANESLGDLNRIFRFAQVKTMSGQFESKARLSGKYSLKRNKLENLNGTFETNFNNCKAELYGTDYVVDRLNGKLYIENNDAGAEDLSLVANGNDLLVDSRMKNIIPYILGKPVHLEASLAVQSNHLNTAKLLAFDRKLEETTKFKIDGLDVSVVVDLYSRALDSYKIMPSGNLEIHKLSAKLEGASPIDGFSGIVNVSPDTLQINHLKGTIGSSPIDLSLGVTNYAYYLEKDTTENMVITLGLQSEKLMASDLFTFNNEFLLPKNYKEEILEKVSINTKLITTNTQLQKKDLLPELEFQFTGLQFKTVHSPVVFKDIFLFGLMQDNNVYVNSLFGKFGRSDLFLNAEFNNVVATKDTVSRPLRSRISFNSGILDLNELVKLEEPNSNETVSADSTQTSNPFEDHFPITDLNVNIGELRYYDASIHNISGVMKIGEDNIIELNHVKLESGEFGAFDFDGTLDASSHKEALLTSTIKIANVNLSKLNVSYVQNGENVKISDHFAGTINGEVVAAIPILQDFSFDLARLTGKVKVKVRDGALINYAPLKEMGKYFKNKDLNYVRFDELKNTMIFNQGKILLPFMTINTTLGTINLMGYQTLDYEMAYDIQVPIKLVAGAALNSLFAGKKGDDTKDDQVKKGGKGKYLTVHISGDANKYNFKLGKKHVLTAPPGFQVD